MSAQISFTDLLAMVASVYINAKTALNTRARVPATPYLNSWMPLQHSWGESRTPFLYSRKDRSFTKKLSCYSDVTLKWQSLHRQSGLKFADCVAPYNNEDVDYTNKEEQSRVQLVTLPFALQQRMLSPAHSALSPKLAKSALQPGLCQQYSIGAFARCVSSHTRDL